MYIEDHLRLTRRHFFSRASTGIGVAALASLLRQDLKASEGGLPGIPHFAPKAKRAIYLFQSGAPSQMELFDYKAKLQQFRASELPDSIRQVQRLTAMTSTQTSYPVAPSMFEFAQHVPSRASDRQMM